MLVEMLLLASSCSVSEAVMGNCLKSCDSSVVIGSDSVTLCRELELITGGGAATGSSSSATANKKTGPSDSAAAADQTPRYPLRCVSGAAAKSAPAGAKKIPRTDVVCYREIPEPELVAPKPVKKSKPKEVFSDSVAEIFSTSPDLPAAFAQPEVLYADELVTLTVVASVHTKPGILLGEPVSVRFSPVSATWDFGDGQSASGFSAGHIYNLADVYQARAKVRYSVDYKFATDSWVSSVGYIDATSNGVFITALPLPRETRLVG